jgi:hypothetical protein
MQTSRRSHRHPIGLTRREVLQVGYSALLGMGLPSLFAAKTQAKPAPSAKAKSALLIFLTGAPSHIDTFDMKPEAPAEVRGTLRETATRAPGVRFCEHLPRLAERAHRLAIVRSMTHGVPVHELGTHFVLSGIDQLPPGSTHMASRNDWPCYASGLDYLRPRNDGIPNGVMLPTYLNAGFGFSGQNAGVLGPKYDPWHIKQDPNTPQFRVGDLDLPIGVSVEQLADRRSLLHRLNEQQAAWSQQGGKQFTNQQHQAFQVLTSRQLSEAFVLDREPPRVRDQYGRHLFGQSLLLSRRLLQAGVPIVQANMGAMNHWDTHTQCCNQLRDNLLPPLDQAVGALLDDLEASGLLAETLVVMLGEFGRTPKLGKDNGGNITSADGRDHWGGVFFAVFAGAGVHGGQCIGKSDALGAWPASRGFLPSDLGATIYHALGVDPAADVIDRQGRPLRLNRGEVIQPLFTGAGGGA